ncbi:MAG: glycosyltransferase family 4 protein [Planctomycetota bacterium]
MKILSVTSQLPWPLNSGGNIRTFYIQKALSKDFDLKLLAPKRPDQQDAVSELRSQGIHVESVAIGERTKLGEMQKIARSLWHFEPYAMYGRHWYREVSQSLDRILAEFRPDLVWLDHLDSWLYADKARSHGVKVVIDLHNIYSVILSRTADEKNNLALQSFLRREAKLLSLRERNAVQEADAILAVSEQDRQHFIELGAKRAELVPNGVDCPKLAHLPIGRMNQRNSILFVGAMNWEPNQSAAILLAKNIFPKVKSVIPEAQLVIVGKSPPPKIQQLETIDGVIVAGQVPEIQPYLERASLLAVPLVTGGGTRLKILEAFAAGLPVVSTPVGAEGIDARDGESLLISEVETMSEPIIQLLASPELGQQIATKARTIANELYDWRVLGEKCVSIANQVIG